MEYCLLPDIRCGPCQYISPYLEELSKSYQTDCIFLKVDGDQHVDILKRFKVNAFPTFIFLKHGEEWARFSGALKSRLKWYIEYLKDKLVFNESMRDEMESNIPQEKLDSENVKTLIAIICVIGVVLAIVSAMVFGAVYLTFSNVAPDVGIVYPVILTILLVALLVRYLPSVIQHWFQ